MSDTSKDRDLHSAEFDARDGSELLSMDSQAPCSNTAWRSLTPENASVVSTSSSNHTLSLLGNASDDAKEFNPDWPTDYGLGEQAQSIKGGIFEALLKSDKDGCEETKNSPRKEDR